MRNSRSHGPSRPERAGARAAGSRQDGRARARQGRARDRGPAGPQAGTVRGPAVTADAGRLSAVIAPAVTAAGMDLESVRVRAVGSRLLVRVIVDADGGVGLDAIADVSRAVSAVLDRDHELSGAPYTLEVSSPGVDRPLTEPKHWRRAAGRLVTAPLAAGAGTVRGRVLAATGDVVTLDVDGAPRAYGYDEIGPGRVQVEFTRAEEPDHETASPRAPAGRRGAGPGPAARDGKRAGGLSDGY